MDKYGGLQDCREGGSASAGENATVWCGASGSDGASASASASADRYDTDIPADMYEYTGDAGL